jgi:hypothetical protein
MLARWQDEPSPSSPPRVLRDDEDMIEDWIAPECPLARYGTAMSPSQVEPMDLREAYFDLNQESRTDEVSDTPMHIPDDAVGSPPPTPGGNEEVILPVETNIPVVDYTLGQNEDAYSGQTIRWEKGVDETMGS